MGAEGGIIVKWANTVCVELTWEVGGSVTVSLLGW